MKIEFPKLECIHPIIIPFEIVPDLLTANVYVLGKKELTLIDPGPGIGGALDRIIEGIESRDLNINDIRRILITHGHMDHYGLTTRIREKIDHPVEVFMHPEDAWRVTPEFFEKKQWNDELEKIIELILKLKSRGRSLIMVTHNLQVGELFNKIVKMFT